MNPMTPDQALDLLDRAAALASLPRQDHAACLQAVQVLRQAISPPPADKPATDPKPETPE